MEAFHGVIGKYVMVGAGQYMRDYRRAHRYCICLTHVHVLNKTHFLASSLTLHYL